MKLTYGDFRKVLNIGIALTTEKKPEKLLASILESGMEITCCDAATLYLYEENQLIFKIMKTLSKNISRGEDGSPIEDIPPVPFKEENVCAYTAIHRTVVNIPDVYNSSKFDFSGPKKYDALTGYHTQSMLVVPLENNEGELIGVLQMINAMDEDGKVVAFNAQYKIIIRSLGSLAAIELTNIRYVAEIKSQLYSFVEAMATAIDERTPYNGSHTRKVAEYALLLADAINAKHQADKCEEVFDELRKEQLELAALLHDIGKMVIPREVMNRATRLDHDVRRIEDRFKLLGCYYEIDCLKKKIDQQEYKKKLEELKQDMDFIYRIDDVGYLNDQDYERVLLIAEKCYQKEDGERVSYITEEEKKCLCIRKGTLTDEARELMENHVVMTSKILSKVHFNKNYENVPIWAGEHHEFLDGSGYPKHLKEDALSLEARILTVADIYDALTASDRPYKQPMPRKEAIRILNNMAEEGKVDKRLVEWLEEAVEEGGHAEN